MDLQDKTLVCKECNKEFIWTVGEQEYFQSKGLKHKPSRCKECRKLNRTRVEAEYYKVVCTSCKQIGETTFKPIDPEAKIYCKDCFNKEFLAKA